MTSHTFSKSLRQGLLLVAALGATFALPNASAAETPAATVVMLTGRATALAAGGTIRTLSKNDAVYSGELINSGPGSYINLKFADGGYYLLRPGTRFQIEDYVFVASSTPTAQPTPAPAQKTSPKTDPAKPEAASSLVVAASDRASGTGSRAFFRLLKGGFKAVSGAIGKVNREEYRLSTPVATIGIRGTRLTGQLCSPGDCEDRSEIDGQLRDSGESTTGDEVVLVTTVQEGEISVTTGTETEIQKPGTVLFTQDTGTITPGTSTPSSMQKESNLDPESCGS